jgi:hypothetical protein
LAHIDAYFDISLPQVAKSMHIKSCILALRQGGRVSLMGGQMEDVPLPVNAIKIISEASRKNAVLARWCLQGS